MDIHKSIIRKEDIEQYKFEKELVFKQPIEIIAPHAFKNVSATSVIFEKDIDKIGEHAFANCSSLRTVIMPCCEKIKEYAFEQCINLDTFEFKHITQINKCAFAATRFTAFNFDCISEMTSYAFTASNFTNIFLKNKKIPELAFSHIYNTRRIEIKDCNLSKHIFLDSSIKDVYVDNQYLNTNAFAFCEIEDLYISNRTEILLSASSSVPADFKNIKHIHVFNEQVNSLLDNSVLCEIPREYTSLDKLIESNKISEANKIYKHQKSLFKEL